MRSWTASTSRLRFAPPLFVAVAACGGSAVTPEPDPVEPSRPVPCTFPNATCAERVEIADGLFLPVYSTHLLSEGHAGVTRGLISHPRQQPRRRHVLRDRGAGRCGGGRVRGHRDRRATLPDQRRRPRSGRTLLVERGMEAGNLSRPEGPSPRVSSYAGLDRMVDAFLTSSRFPAMREIVVAGHSAGGQVVHRFAATTEHKAAESGIGFRYVVTNPSTYLYPGPEREDAAGDFTVPEAGWRRLRRLALRPPGTQQLRRQAARRLDPRPAGSRGRPHPPRRRRHDLRFSLDQSCGANLQGPRRYHRGRTLARFMDALYLRARPPGDDRAGRGALQPVDVAVGGGGGGAVRQLTAGWGPVGAGSSVG